MDKKTTRQLAFPEEGNSSCALCSKRHLYLSCPAEWKNEQACTYVLSLKVSPRSLICCPCRDDVSRVISKSEYTPKWVKSRNH